MRLHLVSALVLMSAFPALAQDALFTITGEAGLMRPEAARYDAANDRYIVGNMGPGGDMAMPNDGYISIVSIDGAVENLKWIAGGANDVSLDNPRGIIAQDGTLFVADSQSVRAFDLMTGAHLASIAVEGAITLNDLAVAADGTIYVTNSANNDNPDAGAIYKITMDGTVSTLIKGAELMRPNGVALDPDGNIVAVTLNGADVVTISPEGQITGRVTLATGRLDGLVILEDGTQVVSSQDGMTIYRIPPGGEPMAIVSNVPGPAAIGFDTMRNRVLVPTINESTVRIFEVQ